MKSATLTRDDMETFVSTLQDALNEIAAMRRESPKLRADIARLQQSTRKRLDRIAREIEHVKAAR